MVKIWTMYLGLLLSAVWMLVKAQDPCYVTGTTGVQVDTEPGKAVNLTLITCPAASPKCSGTQNTPIAATGIVRIISKCDTVAACVSPCKLCGPNPSNGTTFCAGAATGAPATKQISLCYESSDGVTYRPVYCPVPANSAIMPCAAAKYVPGPGAAEALFFGCYDDCLQKIATSPNATACINSAPCNGIAAQCDPVKNDSQLKAFTVPLLTTTSPGTSGNGTASTGKPDSTTKAPAKKDAPKNGNCSPLLAVTVSLLLLLLRI